MTMSKRNVWLVQVNNSYGKNVFLPYSVGIIQAYSQSIQEIRDNYDFRGFIYTRENLDDVIEKMKEYPPDVLGLSCYIWNSNFTLALGKRVKEEFPNCLTVLGGPHVPVKSEEYLKKHSWADVLVHGEGEVPFANILIERAKGKQIVDKVAPRSTADLSLIPSPYLSGVFDNMPFDKYEFHSSQETHRGCPYSCTFCIAEGTEIITSYGFRNIEEIKSGDVVLGFEEGQKELVWNVCENCVCRGDKLVFGLSAGNYYVEATEDHKFYTDQGWKELRDIKPGDKVLSNLWKSNGSFSKNQKDMLEEMYGESHIFKNENKQPHEAKRGCPETRFYNKEENREWGNNPVYVHPTGEKRDVGVCITETVRSRQSDEESDNCCQSRKNQQRKESRQDICQDDSKKSNEGSKISCESNRSIERSNSSGAMVGKDEEGVRHTSQQIREKGGHVFEECKPSISLHGEFHVLGGRMPIGEIQESRFHSQSGVEIGDIGSWNLLASECSGDGTRNKGLQKSGMGGVHNLGRRQIGREYESECKNVSWIIVDKVEKVGIKKVYDIIEAKPSHSVFYNGILGHQCDWGSSVYTKVRKFSDDRIKKELDWCSDRRCDLLYNCIAKGTMVSTINGNVPIENIVSGDEVYGWDKECKTVNINVVQKKVCSGIKDIWSVKHEFGEIRATAKHRIYTKHGWKRVSELSVGDQILSNLQHLNRSQEQKRKILLKKMFWEGSGFEQGGIDNKNRRRKIRDSVKSNQNKEGKWGRGGAYIGCKEKPQKWKLQGGIQCFIRGYNNQIIRKAKGNCRQSSGHKSRTWIFMDDGQKQSNEQYVSRFCREEKKRILSIYEEILGRSKLGYCSFRESWKKSKQIRKNPYRVYANKQFAISFYRRLGVLGWKTMSIGYIKKSRFCLCRGSEGELEEICKPNENGYIGSWNVLAFKSRRCENGVRRLQIRGMGNLYNLGKRKSRREINSKDKEVCWSVISSIKKDGVGEVYDLINAIPTHNFFANGVLVSNCDANFALFERDVEITKYMVDLKKRTGYPNKFRAAYAKNSNDRVYQVSKMLNEAGMSKGTTLSFQSMDDNVLTIIKRKNIKVKEFQTLIQKYRSDNIPTYSEIIIGLAGESYNSFANGLDTLVSNGCHLGLSCYHCEVLPNSEMGDPKYREVHGIESTETPVLFFHGTPAEDPYEEKYEIVTSTKTLSKEDWLKCSLISWAFQCFHCLGLTQNLAVFLHQFVKLSYREFYEDLLQFARNNSTTVLHQIYSEAEQCFKNLSQGKPWGIVDQRFGNIVWPVEEGSFLNLMYDRGRFYHELRMFVGEYPGIDDLLLDDLIEYQKTVVKDPFEGIEKVIDLSHNIYEYLEAAYQNQIIDLTSGRYQYKITKAKDYQADYETYAREVCWWGRKGGTFTHRIERVV